MSSIAALASAAEPAISTVKPTSPSFDFKMPDSRSSSSITSRRTLSPPLIGRQFASSYLTRIHHDKRRGTHHPVAAPTLVRFDTVDWLLQPRNYHLIEMGDAIGLGPQRDAAGPG